MQLDFKWTLQLQWILRPTLSFFVFQREQWSLVPLDILYTWMDTGGPESTSWLNSGNPTIGDWYKLNPDNYIVIIIPFS